MLLEAIGGLVALIPIGYIIIKLRWPWLLLDIRTIARFIPIVMLLNKLKKQNMQMIELFERQVAANPNKVFLIFEDESYTYKEMDEKANRIAQAALALGLKRRDVVALLIGNSPEIIWTCLGLSKIGVIFSLININLRHKQLTHCVTVSQTNLIFVGEDEVLRSAIEDVLPDMPDAKVYVQGKAYQKLPERFMLLDDVLEGITVAKVDKKLREGALTSDPCMYIFTSGTTGLPKAATVTHLRSMFGAGIGKLGGVSADDRVYICMPLYHSSAHLLGLGCAILTGSTVVLAKKFSKTAFMPDCVKHDVTVVIYIGELCRYLLTTEKTGLEDKHKIRVVIGNGMRQDIFRPFRERFRIPWILEFYGATEAPSGNANLDNIDGACGRLSPLIAASGSQGLYKWDIETESLVRDQKGHCVPVECGSVGLLLIGINKDQVYDGYKGRRELTEAKIVRNVRKDGDMHFNSGDLFTTDKDYYIYFNDRIGDTFRWKGENVSTTEVSNRLTELDLIIDACVYGVKIPGHDGRAGMAALLLPTDRTITDAEFLQTLSRFCTENLASYARPLFVTLQEGQLDMTSTAKQSKVKLREDGFDINKVKGVFHFDRNTKSYAPLTNEVYQDILNNTILF